MSIKPILFNTEMVKAILEGRKTQTRRLIKIASEFTGKPFGESGNPDYPLGFMYPCGIKRPPCDNGDILWVRETWAHGYIEHSDSELSCETWFEESAVGCSGFIGAISSFMYRADDHDFFDETGVKWHPSIHMPKEAARIFLRVKAVRVERLQDITEEQAEKEGCSAGRFHITCGPFGNYDEPPEEFDAIEDFRRVWDSTVKPAECDKYGWNANPWVWVIEFECCDRPEGWCAE